MSNENLRREHEEMAAKLGVPIHPNVDFWQLFVDMETSGGFFKASVEKEADLPCALLGCALLEKAVRLIVIQFLVDIKESEGIVNGSFIRNVHLARCLGLISETAYKNYKTIGKIRNCFAHGHTDTKFNDTEIADLCASLTQLPDGTIASGISTPREQYEQVVMMLFIMLCKRMNTLREHLPDYPDSEGWHIEPYYPFGKPGK